MRIGRVTGDDLASPPGQGSVLTWVPWFLPASWLPAVKVLVAATAAGKFCEYRQGPSSGHNVDEMFSVFKASREPIGGERFLRVLVP